MNDLRSALRQLLRNPRFTAVAVFPLMFALQSKGAAASEWKTVLPEEVGLDSAALVEMFDAAREGKIPVHSVQIVRGGQWVLDSYFYPYRDAMRHDVASVTKSITSTLIGLAIERGYISDVKEPVLSFFTNYSVAGLDSRKRGLTLEHLLTMQAGWDCGTHLGDPAINLDPRLAQMRRSADWAQAALDLPMIAQPGTRFAYCNANCHLLSALITKTTGTNALGFARREVFEPLGVRDVAWPADPHGHNHGWGDLQLHPRDMARLGQLFLQRGRWSDRQVIPERWIEQATRAHVERTGGNDRYGYFWWMPGEKYPGLYEAVGRGGQRITIWPAKGLVLVFTGGGFNTDSLTPFVLKALKSDEPLPQNPEASRRLQQRITDAAKPPLPQLIGKLPPVAMLVSGKTFNLSANALGLSRAVLKFDRSPEAQAELVWEGRRISFPVGLDAVERFSVNPLVNLPQAAKGQWTTDDTFLLELDLVGGINYYRLRLTFADAGESLNVSLSERTGLNNEEFQGVRSN